MNATDPIPSVRLDKWLWAARFFKTRALAAEAIRGGKVRIGGTRAKVSRMIRMGASVMALFSSLNIRPVDSEDSIVFASVPPYAPHHPNQDTIDHPDAPQDTDVR